MHKNTRSPCVCVCVHAKKVLSMQKWHLSTNVIIKSSSKKKGWLWWTERDGTNLLNLEYFFIFLITFLTYRYSFLSLHSWKWVYRYVICGIVVHLTLRQRSSAMDRISAVYVHCGRCIHRWTDKDHYIRKNMQNKTNSHRGTHAFEINGMYVSAHAHA